MISERRNQLVQNPQGVTVLQEKQLSQNWTAKSGPFDKTLLMRALLVESLSAVVCVNAGRNSTGYG